MKREKERQGVEEKRRGRFREKKNNGNEQKH